jgi:hypothetical protein
VDEHVGFNKYVELFDGPRRRDDLAQLGLPAARRQSSTFWQAGRRIERRTRLGCLLSDYRQLPVAA